MVRITDGSLLACLRPGLDSRGALVVVEVQQFHLNQLGLSRVVAVDPRGAYAADPEMVRRLARLRPMLGGSYPTFHAAADAVLEASESIALDYLSAFECHVVGALDRALLGERVERLELRGRAVETRFSPRLAHTCVRVTDGAGTPPLGGEWVPIGVLRPFVPAGMSTEDAAARVRQLTVQVRPARPRAASRHQPFAPAPRAPRAHAHRAHRAPALISPLSPPPRPGSHTARAGQVWRAGSAHRKAWEAQPGQAREADGDAHR